MEQKQTRTQTDQKSKVESEPIEITRAFRASVEQVWQAWTNTELVKQWWGPEGYSCPEAIIDFHVGGDYLMAMESPDGKVMWSGGIYEEIIPGRKIVSTDNFTDQNGKILSPSEVGMPGDWQQPLHVTVTFQGKGDDLTEISLTHIGIPNEAHDDCVEGWNSSLNKFQKLVEKN